MAKTELEDVTPAQCRSRLARRTENETQTRAQAPKPCDNESTRDAVLAVVTSEVRRLTTGEGDAREQENWSGCGQQNSARHSDSQEALSQDNDASVVLGKAEPLDHGGPHLLFGTDEVGGLFG